jgi:hypothetical protein
LIAYAALWLLVLKLHSSTITDQSMHDGMPPSLCRG